MAVTSGFFNSLYGDRKYTAEQFSALFNGLINDGVFSNIGTAFRVSATTENVISIGIGRAWFNGIWVNNDAILPMTCNDPEVLLDRIDALVIEINRSEAVRAGRIIFVKGTASGTPVGPTLTHDAGVDQYPLAYIRRKAGVSEVVQADITNCIGTSECPYVTGILETQNIDSIVAQWESEFDIWFDGLQVELSGDVAANLASQIIELNARFNELAETRSVTVELQDSSLDTILDSTGNAILGTTSFVSDGGTTTIVPTDPVVEKSFNYKIGDTLTTARLDLGEEWMLCNGATLSIDEYSSLASVLRTPPEPNFSESYIWEGDYGYDNCIAKMIYADGYQVAVGWRRTGGYSQDFAGCIAYARVAGIPTYTHWTIKENAFTGSYSRIVDVVYGNGYFVALAAKNRNVSIMYTKDPSTSWTTKQLYGASSDSDANAFKVKYINGRFIVCGALNRYDGSRYVDYGVLAYSSNSEPSSAWTVDEMVSGQCYLDINYFDGKYVLLYESSSSIYVKTKTELTDSSWSGLKTIGSGGYGAGGGWTSGRSNDGGEEILYANGCYFVVTALSHTNCRLYLLPDGFNSSAFTVKQKDLSTTKQFRSVSIDNGYVWVLTWQGDIIYAPIERLSDTTFPWIVYENSFMDDNSFGLRISPSMNGYYIYTYNDHDTGTNKRAKYRFKSFRNLILPTVSSGDSLYTYIKVKEAE